MGVLEKMKFNLLGHTLALLASVLLVSSCGATQETELSCKTTMKALNKATENYIEEIYIKATRDQSIVDALDSAVHQTMKACDTGDYDVGLALLTADSMHPSIEKIEELIEQLKPRSKAEALALYNLIAEHYITITLQKDKAEPYVLLLEKIDADSTTAAVTRVLFECAFNRCATVLDEAKSLSQDKPYNPVYRALLGRSLADRHQFKEAVEQYDWLVENKQMHAFDSGTALIAVAAYSNAGDKAKAKQFYDLYAAIDKPMTDASNSNFMNMKKVVEDQSGQIFLFAPWPIEDNKQ